MHNQLSVLAFAAGALAVPYHGHGHGHFHYSASGSAAPSDAPFPYSGENWNTTSAVGPTGTGSSMTSMTAMTSVATTTITEVDTYGNAAPSNVDAASASTDCTTDITVTTTQQETVYVTKGASSSSHKYTSTVYLESTSYVYPGQSSSASASSSSAAAYTPSSSSSAAAYTPSSSSSAAISSSAAASTSSSSSAPAYVASSSSSEASPVTTSASSSSYVAPSSYAASSSSVSTADLLGGLFGGYGESSSSSVAASSTYAATSSYAASSISSSASSASASSTSSSSPMSGKRGLAYDDVSLTDCFLDSSNIGWGYNWVSASKGLSSSIEFIPTLHSGASEWTSVWATEAGESIANGAKTVFSFNEPDQSSQANMSPSDAAAVHKQYMEPLADQATICAPSVSNGQGTDPLMGLDWLLEFMSECSDCTIGCINIHWYNTAEYQGDFQDHVTNATNLFPGLPVWITEFGLNDASEDEVNSFLEDSMPWLDQNTNVTGYAYYYVNDGILNSGNAASTIGSTYMDFTS